MVEMSKKLRELEEQIESWIEIDMNDLPREWEEHSSRFFKLGVMFSKVRAAISLAKMNQDYCQSDMTNKILANPEKYKLVKTTADAVKAAVTMTKEYIAASEAVEELNLEYNILQSGINAFDHRKRALQGIVELRGQQWNSEPVDRSGGKAKEHFDRESAYAISAIKLKKKKRKD